MSLLDSDAPPHRDDVPPLDEPAGDPAATPADGGGDVPPSAPQPPPRDDTPVRRWIDLTVVAACAAFVFWQLHPSLLLADTTPAGGDMGAHVWALGYLRDHLLTEGRWAGWTPDWYAGFPVFQFYMVVPFLLMVALNTGVSGPLVVVPVALAAAAGWASWRSGPGRRRTALAALAGAVLVLGISAPFGVAFKLVTVAGVVAMPATAYLFGRLARFPFPTPALMAVAALVFLFDKRFTIYGGNIASTLAGEFAFSISLALALAYLGVLVHGLRTGTHRVTAAVLLALVGLCHLIPAFFAILATAVILGAHLVSEALQGRRGDAGLPTGGRRFASRTWWVVSAGAVAGLLASWWVLPFFWQRTYLNDMGWEKIAVRADGQSVWQWLFGDVREQLIHDDLAVVAVLAAVGAVLSVVFVQRMGIALTVLGLALATAFVVAPQGRLWNARLLPFWYLVVYLLAAVAVGEVARALATGLASDPDRPVRPLLWVTPCLALLVYGSFQAAQLRKVPFGETRADGSYEVLGIPVKGRNFVTDWSRWNYTGYERKAKYPEYRDIVATMAELGETNGCGRAMWEYKPELDQYGTPMALMLLPHWTDGCIGSMEGLYFEASSTTPFHFLVQSELSASPSRAQRRLPYRALDVQKGIEHLQLMGVRYYMATSTSAIDAARANPSLRELAYSGPWTIFEVADAPVVEALPAEPAVTTASEHQEEWLCSSAGDPNVPCDGVALEWFQDSARWDVALTARGPDAWQRVDPGEQPVTRPIEPATVTDVEVGRDTVRFRVDEPGKPVLVKMSYFPNWRVEGADGPYRAAPNFMVVVPTDEEVTLRFARTGIDWAAALLALVGIALAAVLARRPALALPGLPDPEAQSAPAARTAGPDDALPDDAVLDDAVPDDAFTPPAGWQVTAPTPERHPQEHPPG